MSTPQPGWFTADIVGLIRTMRENGVYSGTDQKKLAGLLEAAGCPEADSVSRLRGGLRPLWAAREIALLLDGDYADAVRTLDAAAAEVQAAIDGKDDLDLYDYAWLVTAFRRYAREGAETYFDNGKALTALWNKTGPLWAAYQLVTASEVAVGRKVDSPFSRVPEEDDGGYCSC